MSAPTRALLAGQIIRDERSAPRGPRGVAAPMCPGDRLIEVRDAAPGPPFTLQPSRQAREPAVFSLPHAFPAVCPAASTPGPVAPSPEARRDHQIGFVGYPRCRFLPRKIGAASITCLPGPLGAHQAAQWRLLLPHRPPGPPGHRRGRDVHREPRRQRPLADLRGPGPGGRHLHVHGNTDGHAVGRRRQSQSWAFTVCQQTPRRA